MTLHSKNLAYLFFILTFTSFGQAEVSFDKESQSIVEPDNSNVKIEVKFKCENLGDKDSVYIHGTIDRSATTAEEKYDFEFVEDSMLVTKAKNSGSFWVQVKNDSKVESNEVIAVTFKSSLDKGHAVDYKIGKKSVFKLTIEEVPDYDYIRLTTGIDFDFDPDQNSKPIAFYGNLNGFFPDQFNDRWGIMFNVFSNRFISLDTLRSTETRYVANGFLDGDSIAYKRVAFRSQENLNTRNFGVNVGGLCKVAKEGNSSFYIGLQLEGAITRSIGTYSYDTLAVLHDSTSLSNFSELSDQNGLLYAKRITVFTPSLTLLLPYRYENDKIEARVILGSTLFSYFDFADAKKKMGLSPYFDVNVVDKSFGVTIGGNIRYDYITNSPAINIYIAKSFRFSQFAKF